MVNLVNTGVGCGAGAVAGAGVGLLGGIFDPVTVPAGAVVGCGVGALTSTFGGSTTNNTTNQNSYISQNQIKSNEIILGKGSKLGQLTIKDKMTAGATAKQSAKQSQTSGISPLLLAIGGAGAIYLINRGNK